MHRLFISLQAQADVLFIKSYFAKELLNPGAGMQRVVQVLQRIRDLQAFPLLGESLATLIHRETPYFYLQCGNYVIFYRCDQSAVYVLRVLKASEEYIKAILG